MAAPKRPTHVVEHKRLFLAVKGKLEHVEKGTQLTLTEKQASGLGPRVRSLKDAPLLDLEAQAAAEAAAKNAG